ncbi:MAG: cache domain-containing protein [Desulfobacterales bacterium]|nr:MAG: cache domain-containing protein [Desulfobacterales bacterium]
MKSLRAKFFFALFVMFLILGGIFSLNGYMTIRSIVFKEAQNHVQSTLRVAWSEYIHNLDDITRILQLIGGKIELLKALKSRETTWIATRLEQLRKQYGLDFITVLDREAKVFVRSRYPNHQGDMSYLDGVVLPALKGKEAKGTVTIPKEILELEGEGLAQRAFLEFVPTPMAKLTPMKYIDSGMALKAAVPIWDGNEQIGLIYGGVLLNRNYALVDRIQETVFRDGTYEGHQLGTVTIFQWDTRIATTVRNENRTRAIGTRVSAEVYDRVLENGLAWLGKAFVVRDWYLSAYDPIVSPEGNIVGIIYVGVLEKKFADYQKRLLSRFLLIAGVGISAALILSYVLLSTFVRPVKRLARASAQVSKGHFPSKIQEEKRYKELYDLTRTFNVMIQSIRERDEMLRQVNTDLTHINEELKNQNRNYMELLGFVVHELKSPINSIIYGLSALMSQSMGYLSDRQTKVAQIIIRNAEYLDTMIRNYLDLSRIETGELALYRNEVTFEEQVIRPIKVQLLSQLEASQMNIVDEVPPDTRVECDEELMKVVMNNLLSNAIKYGSPNSEIRIRFQDLDDAIQIGVWNEGEGIPASSIKKLFAKFTDLASRDRTGKRGTGLGLFITKELVERHGGAIWADSEEGKWVQFTFRIPKRRKNDAPETAQTRGSVQI